MQLFFTACVACLCSVGIGQVATAPANGQPQPTILLSRVNVVDVTTGSLLPDRDVLVAHQQIVSIRKHSNAGRQKAALLIPAQGQYLVPGLIDCHTHLFYKEDLAHYLGNGVTTLFSLGQPQAMLQVRDAVKEGTVAGPTLYLAALVDTVPQDWQGKVYSYTVHSPAAVATAMQRIKALRYNLIKAYNSLTTPQFNEVMRQAKRYRMPVIGHGVRQPGMEQVLAKGMAMVAHGEEYLYTVFKDSLDERKIPAAVAFTKKYGAYVCANLSTFRTLLMQWGDSLRFARLLNEAGDTPHRVSPSILDFWQKENHYIHRQGAPLVPMYPFLQKLIYALYKAGVPLVAGTDSPIIPGCFPGYSMVTELQLLTEAGLPPADALQTATLVPGRFIAHHLPQEPKTGIIKVGYAADLLLVSQNPLQNVENLRKIEGVMAKGRWYTREQLKQLENQ